MTHEASNAEMKFVVKTCYEKSGVQKMLEEENEYSNLGTALVAAGLVIAGLQRNNDSKYVGWTPCVVIIKGPDGSLWLNAYVEDGSWNML